MKSGTNQKGYFYYIWDVYTGLPSYIADTRKEACLWLGCSEPTLSRLILTGASFEGFGVKKLNDE